MQQKKHLFILLSFTLFLIIIDQIFKIYIKTHFLIGEEINVLGNWFKIHFIENAGMAYGLKFSDGRWAKITLSLFRLMAIIAGVFYVIKHWIPRNNKTLNFILATIIAGAIGNLIDSLFYGLIFSKSDTIYTIKTQCAVFTTTNNYGYVLEGDVVDMLYFPIIQITLPKWIPFWGGTYFEFFSPIFNFADSCISIGVFTLILFNKKFFKNKNSSTETK